MRRSQLAAITASGIALAVSSGVSFGFNVTSNFAGGSGEYSTTATGIQNNLTPPDVNGAVGYSGTTEYVTEMINGYYGVYSPTGVASTQENMNTFWASAAGYSALGSLVGDPTGAQFGLAGSSGAYDSKSKLSIEFTDPRILYDPSSSRWFSSTLAVVEATNTTSHQQYILSSSFLVGASRTSNPNGAWSGFVVPSQPTPVATVKPVSGSSYSVNAWADFDTLGVNGGNLYLNGNLYFAPNPSTGGYYAGFPQNTFIGSSNILAIPKGSLLAAMPSVGGYQVLHNIPSFTNQAAQNFSGSTTTGYFYGTPNSNFNQLVQTTLVGTSAGNYQMQQGIGSTVSLNVGNGNTAVPAAGQPGLPGSISVGDFRLSSNLTTAEGLIWGTQTVANPTNPTLDAVRWFAINPSNNTVLAQGILTNSSNSLYYGSIAVSTTGAIVIDFAESGSAQYISTYIATGTFNGTNVTIGTPTLLHAGTGIYLQQGLASGAAARWGDYSTVQVDPNNPSEFWIFQELPNGTNQNQWDTQITAIDPPGGIGGTVPEPGVLPILFLGAAPLLLTLRRRKFGN